MFTACLLIYYSASSLLPVDHGFCFASDRARNAAVAEHSQRECWLSLYVTRAELIARGVPIHDIRPEET